jgi:hypothetical protein
VLPVSTTSSPAVSRADVFTGWGQEHDHQRALAARFDHHVVRPLGIDKLRELFLAAWSHSPTEPM